MDIGADLCTGLHRNQHDNRVYFHEIWHSDADRIDCDDAGSGWAEHDFNGRSYHIRAAGEYQISWAELYPGNSGGSYRVCRAGPDCGIHIK